MSERRFYIVDVFAETRFAGNQLAVFRDGNNYSDAEMQKIAKEMNFSETTFIASDEPRNGGYDVRYLPQPRRSPLPAIPRWEQPMSSCGRSSGNRWIPWC